MKKTVTKIIYTGIFLIAVLVLWQKLPNDQTTSTRTSSTGNAIPSGHSGNTFRIESDIKMADVHNSIGNPSLDTDNIIFTSEDPAHKNEDDLGDGNYSNARHNAVDSERTTNNNGYIGNKRSINIGGNGNNTGGNTSPHIEESGKNTGEYNGARKSAGSPSTPDASTGTGGVKSRNTDRPYTEDRNDTGGNTTPHIRENGKNTRKDNAVGRESTENTPSASAGVAQDPTQSDPGAISDTDDVQTPEIINRPPGTKDDHAFPPSVTLSKTGDHKDPENDESAKISGTNVIPEPVSILLIGLGGMILLWLRRRRDNQT